MFALPEGFIQGENVDCGYLVVPEDRAQPTSRTIRLAVAVFHPDGGPILPDPVLYLSGGPGGSALESLRYAFEGAFSRVLASGRDLIIFDQRGVGRSEPALDCPARHALSWELLDHELDGHTLTDDDILDLYVSLLGSCADELRQQADLTAYHSAANAADVAELRRVLGYDQLNLWAASYGTRLALTVMRDHPEGVRAVLLDSVYPPDVDLTVDGQANAARAFSRFFESCTENSLCDERYPDLEMVFYETVTRLDEAPVTRTITDTRTALSYPALTNGDTLVGLVFQILYDSELRLVLPRLIYAAHEGEFSELDAFRSALLARGPTMSVGMTFSVQCHEEVAFSSEAAFHQALDDHPAFRGVYTNALAGGLALRVCDFWGAGMAPPLENEPVHSDIPTLVYSGDFDPVTPPQWGEQAAETLTNATVHTFPWAGHGVSFSSGCAQAMWLEFLEDPTVPPDATCLAE